MVLVEVKGEIKVQIITDFLDNKNKIIRVSGETLCPVYFPNKKTPKKFRSFFIFILTKIISTFGLPLL